MKIAVGCDEAAVEMKEVIKKHLEDQGHTIQDLGVNSPNPVLYPDIAVAVGLSVAKGENAPGGAGCRCGFLFSVF